MYGNYNLMLYISAAILINGAISSLLIENRSYQKETESLGQPVPATA